MNHILSIDCYKNDYTSRERDLMRVAGMMHDTRKSGSQYSYEGNKFTKFDHPIQAANVIREYKEKYLSEEEVERIAKMIESHMGQWNTNKRSVITLPLPIDKFQKLVHLSDYLASRKDIEIHFNNDISSVGESVETYILPFGKHKGKTFVQINKEDPSYIVWARNNMTAEPARTILMQLEEDDDI